MKNIPIIVFGIVIIAIIVFLGFRSYQKKPATSTEVVTTTNVEIKDMAFSPAAISVSPGQTVSFVNNDNINHTVTAIDNSFDIGVLVPGETYTKTFDSPVIVSYYCKLHPSMQGRIEVK